MVPQGVHASLSGVSSRACLCGGRAACCVRCSVDCCAVMVPHFFVVCVRSTCRTACCALCVAYCAL